jgi:acetylornithine deacetylase/succinyl-diaminopimelate desuccinylase-like protein
LIGDRPAGQTPSDSVILQAATKAVTSFEETPPRLKGASTDGNLPMSLGIPTVVMGNGGLTGGFHSPNEWFDPKNEWVGAQAALATVLELVGVDGITEPLLVKRAGAK